MVARTRTFPRGVVASPHHLASAAGQRVLADGGNAIDAAVAANLVLAVVTPYYCGVGGDLLAIVHDGRPHGLASIGRAPQAATVAGVRSAIAAGYGDADDHHPGTAGMPRFGALSVTVPGAVAGWFSILERFGSRSFGELATDALRLADEGFEVDRRVAAKVATAARRYPVDAAWQDHYGPMRHGGRFCQPDLAGTLRHLAEDGPDALYDGPIGAAIVETLQAQGSTMERGDLASHRVDHPTPLRGRFRDIEVLELPPPTQGLTALTALGVLDALGPAPADRALATHLRLEAVRAAMADRQQHLGDPDTMSVDATGLLAPDRLRAIAGAIDPDHAADWPPARPMPGGTAYLCAADDDGLMVSLIQSNFVGFGSGVVVPGTGIGLHNRGSHFSLDEADPHAIGPGRRPRHTLIPAMALRDEDPWLVFGTQGGDGQPQIHLQLLARVLDEGLDLQEAVDAPRFIVDVADGAVRLEGRYDGETIDGLAGRGHLLRYLAPYADDAGHAHMIARTSVGYAAASDPRCDGAAIGW